MPAGGKRKGAGARRAPSAYLKPGIEDRSGYADLKSADQPVEVLQARGMEAAKYAPLAAQARHIARKSMDRLEEALNSDEKIAPGQLATIAERAVNVIVKMEAAATEAASRERGGSTGADIALKARMLKAAAAELLKRDEVAEVVVEPEDDDAGL